MVVHLVYICLSPVNSEVFIPAVNSINIKDTNSVCIIIIIIEIYLVYGDSYSTGRWGYLYDCIIVLSFRKVVTNKR